MSYQTIRSAQKAAWPAVQASIVRHEASRALVRTQGALATAAAQARARVPWNRVVTNETVWALAKADLLNTPEQAAVLQAARAWVKSWERAGTAPDHNDEPEDVELYRAVQALIATPEVPEDE